MRPRAGGCRRFGGYFCPKSVFAVFRYSVRSSSPATTVSMVTPATPFWKSSGLQALRSRRQSSFAFCRIWSSLGSDIRHQTRLSWANPTSSRTDSSARFGVLAITMPQRRRSWRRKHRPAHLRRQSLRPEKNPQAESRNSRERIPREQDVTVKCQLCISLTARALMLRPAASKCQTHSPCAFQHSQGDQGARRE